MRVVTDIRFKLFPPAQPYEFKYINQELARKAVWFVELYRSGTHFQNGEYGVTKAIRLTSTLTVSMGSCSIVARIWETKKGNTVCIHVRLTAKIKKDASIG